ncbi:hypothetical protein D3C76_1318670 [compost metagenome]
MDDCPQAVGVCFQLTDEGDDPGFAGEIREQPDRAQIAQGLYTGTFAAVTENHAMAILEQSLRAMQADTLAGTGDQNGGCRRGHERLASR